jgi:hypothetical protein
VACGGGTRSSAIETFTEPAGECTFLGGTKVVYSISEWLEFWKLERWSVVEGPEVQL